MKEFYIDGVSMDLDTGFNFGLVYNSTIFTDISKIASNRTTTIKLPKTAKNLGAVKNCDMPDNGHAFPYKKHKAEYWIDGIPIITDGIASLIQVSDYIEISMVWGNKANVSEFGNAKLRELPGDDSVIWNDDVENRITTGHKNYGFAYSDYGLGIGYFLFIHHASVYHHPFVSVRWLLNKISSVTGVNFIFTDRSNNYINENIDKLYLSLNEKNASRLTSDYGTSFFFVNNDLTCGIFSDNTGIIDKQIEGEGPKKYELTFLSREKGTMYFGGPLSYSAAHTIFQMPIPSTDNVSIRFYEKGKDDPLISIKPVSVTNSSPTVYSARFDFDKSNSSVEVNENERIEMKFFLEERQIQSVTVSSGLNLLTVSLETKLTYWQGLFPIIPNLPDITFLDFIKNVMHLFGLFAVSESENTINFYQTEELYDRIPKAKDWSDRLISGSDIESITYTFMDYAQNNYLRYLKDETTTVNADAPIVVYNETLEKEKDVVELKFAASDQKSQLSSFYPDINPVIFIPLYKYKQEEYEVNGETRTMNVPVYDKTTNRIAEMEIRADDSVARFPETMYFGGPNGRIKTYYKDYQKTVENPKVIEAVFRLSNLDLYETDLLTPVYLRQTGRYYAITDINFSEGRAKCKLLQM